MKQRDALCPICDATDSKHLRSATGGDGVCFLYLCNACTAQFNVGMDAKQCRELRSWLAEHAREKAMQEIEQQLNAKTD
jgi:hypothetical protein